MLWRVWGSRPIVGSSRKSTRGECRKPRAISRRRFMPPENVITRLPRRSHRPTMSSTWRIRGATTSRGTPYSSACRRRFCSAVRYPSSVGSWKTSPMLRRTSSRSCATSWPATRARPPVGRASVQSMWIVVVLPAPLGPRKPNTSPRATSKLTPRTASMSPKDFTSCSTSIAADMAGTLGRSSTVAVVLLPPGAPRDARVVEQQAGLVVDQDAAEVVGARGVVEAPLRRAAVDPRVALLEALHLEAQRPHVGGGRLRLAAGREREAVHGEGVGQRGGLEVDVEAA